MDITAVIFHKGALAHYTVSQREGNGLVARLLAYSGDPASSPPKQVSLVKTGRHCTGSIDDEELMDEIYHATKSEVSRRGQA